MKEIYIVEADGGIFARKKQGRILLPQSPEQIPFEFQQLEDFELEDGTKVYFCTPRQFSFNKCWPWKEDLIASNYVDEIVKKALLRTKPNLYAGTIVPNEDDKNSIVLVHNCRGYSKGVWSLPGGVMRYAESPDTGAIRETKEESGLEVVLDEGFATNIFYVQTRACGKSGRYSVGFACFCRRIGGELKPNNSDTDDAKYYALDDLPENTNRFTQSAINIYKKFL